MKKISFISLLFLGIVMIAISCQKNLSTQNEILESPSLQDSKNELIGWLKKEFPNYDFTNTRIVNSRILDDHCVPEPPPNEPCNTGLSFTLPVIISPECTLDVTMDVTWCAQINTAFFTEVQVDEQPGSTCDIDDQMMQDGYNGYVAVFMTTVVANSPTQFNCDSGSFATSNYTQMTCTVLCQKNEEIYSLVQLSCATTQACCENISTWCEQGEGVVSLENEEKTLVGECSGYYSPTCFYTGKTECKVTNCE